MNLFGIEDLDDIIKVTPIKSMRKIESMEPCKENCNYDFNIQQELARPWILPILAEVRIGSKRKDITRAKVKCRR
jgi:hypothetical protein